MRSPRWGFGCQGWNKAEPFRNVVSVRTWSQGKSSLGMVHGGRESQENKSHTIVVCPWGKWAGFMCPLNQLGFALHPSPSPFTSWVRRLLFVGNYPEKGAMWAIRLQHSQQLGWVYRPHADDLGGMLTKNTTPEKSGKWAPSSQFGRSITWGDLQKTTVT